MKYRYLYENRNDSTKSHWWEFDWNFKENKAWKEIQRVGLETIIGLYEEKVYKLLYGAEKKGTIDKSAKLE